jgi:hypothetical protein
MGFWSTTGGDKAFVVFGKRSNSTINLGSLGAGGYEIDGPSDSLTGFDVSNAGDVNHDGTPDAIIGAPHTDFTGTDAGSAYVVFGKPNTVAVNLRTLGNSGYRIDGEGAGDLAGSSVALAGDVNGDGTKDALIGAPWAGDTVTGAAYLVHGKNSSATVSLAALGQRGYRLQSTPPDDYLGGEVAGAGDFNDDGRPDLLIGAELSSPYNRRRAGSAYVVYGQSGTAPVDLTSLGTAGLRIDGAARNVVAGSSVAGEGDFDHNSVSSADVFVGAPDTSANQRDLSGSVYVIHGLASLHAEEARAPLYDETADDYFHGSSPERVGPLGDASAARSAVRPPVIRYRTRRAVTVTLRFVRLVAGRRRIGKAPLLTREGARSTTRCVASTRALRRARPCLRALTLGRIVRRHSRPGSHRIVFSGRVGSRTLPVGRYLLIATARDSRGGGGHQVARFTVR